jgi:chromosome partitioning protein
MKIISFLNHKGGVGKTTLCSNIAQSILRQDEPRSILLVDADPQGSLRDWHDALDENIILPGIEVIGADRRNTLVGAKDIALNIGSGYMMIDTPGDIKEIHGVALRMADLVIIPIRPSPYDVWATEDTIELVRTARGMNEKLKAAIVINQAIPNTRIHAEVLALLAQYSDFFIPKFHVSHRISFAKTAALGKTVFDSNDLAAIKEVDCLTFELLDYLYDRSSNDNQAA